MSELQNANGRRMVSLLLDGPKTGYQLVDRGVYDPKVTADVLKRAGYLVHETETDYPLAARYELVGRQGELTLAY
jgi:hypothetical protein